LFKVILTIVPDGGVRDGQRPGWFWRRGRV